MSKKNKSNVAKQKTNLEAEVVATENVETEVKAEETKVQDKKADKKQDNKKAKADKNGKKKDAKEKGKLKRKAKETISEIKKVTWPSFGEVCKKTGVVLVVVLIFAIVIFGIDTGLGALMGLIAR